MPRRPSASSETVSPSVAFTTAIANARAVREQPTGGSTSTYVPVPLTPTKVMQGDAGSGGESGVVPAPAAGDSTKYLRGDGTWATPTASVSATDVEIDLGSTPVFAGKFTITDAAISGTSKVLCWQAPGPYTDKGASADAAAMEVVQVIAVEPGTGSAVVRWQTPPVVGADRFRSQGRRDVMGLASALVPVNARRVNRVWKKIKFSYMVLA